MIPIMYHVHFRKARRVKGNKGLGVPACRLSTGPNDTDSRGGHLLDANFTIHYGHPDSRLRAARIPGPVLCGSNSVFLFHLCSVSLPDGGIPDLLSF